MDSFHATFRAYPVALMPSGSARSELLHGGKIIMPVSSLRKITEMDLNWPLLFRISNDAHSTHCGVLEFTAEEGRVYLPQWMMETLFLQPSNIVEIETAELAPGESVKVQPQHVNFLEIDDPKAALELAMKNFSALTVGDNLSFAYGGQVYNLLVLETVPEDGVSVIDTDLEVDFAPPVGYIDPETKKAELGNIDNFVLPERNARAVFEPFAGSARKLDGTLMVETDPVKSLKGQDQDKQNAPRVPAALCLPPGRLFFGYPIQPVVKSELEEC